jgi:hypothetical protein
MPDDNTNAPQPTPAPKQHRWLPQSRFLRVIVYSGLAIIALNAVAFAVVLYFGTRPNLPYTDYFPEFKKLSIEAHTRHAIAPAQTGQPDAWVILEGIRSRTERVIDAWTDEEEKRRAADDPPDFERIDISKLCRTLLQSPVPVAHQPVAPALNDLINRLDEAGVWRYTAMLPTAAAALPTADDLDLNADQPSRIPLLTAANVLCLRARIAADSGDGAAALTHLTEADALADRLDSQPNMLKRMLGSAIRTGIDDAAMTLASRRLLTQPHLGMLAVLLDQPREAGYSTALKGERISALHLLQSFYYGRATNSGTLTKNPAATGADPQQEHSLVAALLLRVFSSHSANAAAVNHIYDLADQADTTPFPNSRDLDDAARKATDEIPSRLLMARTVTGIMPGSVRTASSVAWHAAARSAVAIERFRQDRGTLPTSLDDLIPTYLSEHPQDFFAPDRRLRYRVDDPKQIPGYTLYSVGYDQTDNNGTPAREPFEAMRDIGTGTDYIFVSNRAAGIQTP